jgi:hypothetical protein
VHTHRATLRRKAAALDASPFQQCSTVCMWVWQCVARLCAVATIAHIADAPLFPCTDVPIANLCCVSIDPPYPPPVSILFCLRTALP